MKAKSLLTLVLGWGVFFSLSTSGQIVGDYRSVGGGTDWNTAANWQRCIANGTWVGATSLTYPGQNAAPAGTTVTIRNGHTRIIDSAIPQSIVNLVVGEGATGTMSIGTNGAAGPFSLTCSGTVTVSAGGTLSGAGNTAADVHTLTFQSTLTNNGTISFTAATDQVTLDVTGATSNFGTMTFSSNTGVKTFRGAVSNTGTWTSTVLATTTNLIFRNGVSSTAGTFAAGGATFNTNTPQSIGGTTAMSFSGVVTIAAGITVNNTNTNTLTLSNAGVALASGGAGSTFTQGTTTNTLSYAGSSIGVASFNATGTNNTVNYTGATPAIRATTYNNLTFSGTGPATIGGATAVNATMLVSSPVTNNSTLTVTTALSGGSTLTQGASSTLNIGGASGITGLSASAATNTVNYTGAGQTIKTPTTTYLNLGLSGSANKAFPAALTISGNLTISGTAVANLGTFTHTANTLTLGAAGQVSGSHGSTGSTANNKNDTYFLNSSSGIVNVTVCSVVTTGTAITYYSRNATLGGNWNDNDSWTTIADGTGGPLAEGVWPRRFDNVVVRSGHAITIDEIDDNLACGVSPDGLGRANVGPVASIPMFYQTGDILVDGTFTVTGVEIMVEGYTRLTSTAVANLGSTLVNLGYLEVDASAVMSGLDDIILTGNSTTIINTNSTLADDLIIDFTNATLCGTGTTALTTNGGSRITYLHAATQAQICTTFQVTCPNGGCAGGAPTFGTGTVISGNTGPGGIDKRDGTGSLEFWLDSYDVNGNGTNPANGATVVTWSDKSGNGVNVTQNITNVATYSATGVTFNNTGYLLGSDVTFPSGGTARTAYVCASTPNTTTDDVLFFYGNDVASQSYGILKTATEGVRNYFYGDDLDDVGGWLPAGQTKVVNTRYASNFREIFVDGTSTITDAATPNTPVGIDGVQVGGWSAFNLHSNATIKEVILYSKAINNAQRIIIDNYLAAKYNSTLASNDIYTMDNAGNGNFDFEVAGIGQASNGSNHRDAQGSGVVRMWNPNGLANGEFLIWGHDNATLNSSTLTGVSAPITDRLSRTWRVSETGDVGSVSISFDISALTGIGPLGSNLRLLIDRDNDGFADNDVTPIAGTFVDNAVVFSGVNFQDDDKFTLGNTDLSRPLPIELISFSAKVDNNVVKLSWSTASEINNDFFTIERASNIDKFEEIGRHIPGAGTTHEKKNYFETDENPLYGRTYYRLKQTDFDGKFSYSTLVLVNFEGSSLASLRIYPNPLNNKQTLKVEMTGLKGVNEVPMVVYNSLGQKIIEKTISVDQSGTIQEEIFFKKPLSPGVFIVKAGPTLQLTQRLVVE